MAKNQIQMQKGLSLDQFTDAYGSEAQCEAAVEKSKWPLGYCCAKCGADNPYTYRKGSVKVFQCRSCRKQETLTEGTIFDALAKAPVKNLKTAMLGYWLSDLRCNRFILPTEGQSHPRL